MSSQSLFNSHRPGSEPAERKKTISIIVRLIRRLRWDNEKSKSLKLKAYYFQIAISGFIKRHRTIKLIHLLRNYSAMAVVVSSSFLVSATNIASGPDSGSFLGGYWGGGAQAASVTSEKRSLAQASQKKGLVFLSLAKPNVAVDINAKENSDRTAILPKNGLLNSNVAPMKDPEEDGGVKIYEVQPGDTVSSIALAHRITSNTILWANDIEDINSIQPGDRLFILPVAGLTYTVKKGDDLDALAKKYQADRERIIAFNTLPADGRIEEGQEIIIPDGRKESSQPATSGGLIDRRQYANSTGGTPTISGWKKLEGDAGSGHKFPYGYCTWYVAQRRYVPWGGNAGTWLYHAKALGYKTGKNPEVGAIMVSSESWWGHVAIVEKVGKGTITVSEMNYKGWAKKSSRVIPTSSRVIKGYIY